MVASSDVTAQGQVVLALDLRRAMPGRGCWLHPDLACFDLAVRRRAFTRALRVQGTADTDALRTAFEAALPQLNHQTGSGFDSDERPMSTQQ